MDFRYMFENVSSKAGADFLHHHPLIAIPYLTVISTACLLGTVGNIMVIGAVFIDKHLKTTCNIFIVNLACADICVTAFVDPFGIIGLVRGEVWFLDRYMLCEVIASVCLTSCFCSLLSIGAISFNRYIHICHHESYRKIYTTRNTLLICLGLWSVSFLLEVPNFIGWGDHVYDRKTQSCIWDRTADFSYSVFFSVVGVAFPVTLIAICYAKIFLYVKASQRRITQACDSATTKRVTESMRLARTLFTIFFVFAVCWSPYAIVVASDKSDTWPHEVHLFTVMLAHTNSSLNFVLYGLTNRHFRDGYIRLLKLDTWLVSSTRSPRLSGSTNFEASAIIENEIENELINNENEIYECENVGTSNDHASSMP